MTNPHEITVEVDHPDAASLVDLVVRSIQATLTQINIEEPLGVAMLLTGDERLQQLNRDFRGYDEPTDVLSFPFDEKLPDDVLYLGDIAISIETAIRQATAMHHTLEVEIALLSVHGTLHLLGYDHINDEEREEMWRIQDEILAMLALGTDKA